MTLFEIGNRLVTLQLALESAGWEETDETRPLLEEYFAELGTSAEKVGNYVNLIKSYEGDALVCQAMLDQFEAKKQTAQKAASFWAGRLRMHFEQTGQTEVKTPQGWKVTLGPVGGTPPVVLTGPIPDEFMRVKPAPAPEPDKVKIAAALKTGPLEFAEFGSKAVVLKIK